VDDGIRTVWTDASSAFTVKRDRYRDAALRDVARAWLDALPSTPDKNLVVLVRDHAPADWLLRNEIGRVALAARRGLLDVWSIPDLCDIPDVADVDLVVAGDQRLLDLARRCAARWGSTVLSRATALALSSGGPRVRSRPVVGIASALGEDVVVSRLDWAVPMTMLSYPAGLPSDQPIVRLVVEPAGERMRVQYRLDSGERAVGYLTGPLRVRVDESLLALIDGHDHVVRAGDYTLTPSARGYDELVPPDAPDLR
jgi:hypothetical protein